MRVAMFVTCLTDTFYPRVGEAVVRLLRHFGCNVEFPEQQTCCGQPAFNSGLHQQVIPLAKRMIRIFEPYDRVVTPSASCGMMFRRHYVDLLAGDAEWSGRARALAAKTREVMTFLHRELEVDIARHLVLDEPVTFHYPCHARGTYTADDLAAWLTADGKIDLRLPEQVELCCGFGGVFAVEQPEISGAMLGDKLDVLAATGAELVVCNEAGCALNMAGGARRRGLPLRFKHLAECLAESLGLLESSA